MYICYIYNVFIYIYIYIYICAYIYTCTFWLPLPKICHTYPAMIKLGTVISYLRKIQKISKSRGRSVQFC